MDASRASTPLTSKIDIIRGQYKALGPVSSFTGPHIFVLRHGESISEVFPDWIQRCELDASFYVPFDLNMPISIPRRNPMKEAYAVDPPLSEIGKICTQMVAREIVSRKASPILAIYSAPSLASLQTAHEISHYLGSRCGPIRINADLSINRSGSEFWLTEHQLQDLDYNVDHDYKPMVTMDTAESIETMQAILQNFIKDIATLDGSVIVVADSLTVKCIYDSHNGIIRDEDLQKAHEIAETCFPPNATCTFQVVQGVHEILVEPSPLTVRPITAIGLSSAQNKEADMDFV